MDSALRPRSDVMILGAGIIGLSLALELRSRGYGVTVVEQGTPMAQASSAAAGMLAVSDPHNPPELLALSTLSGALYPAFLARIGALSDCLIPFQTEATWQTFPDGTVERLAERSIDPRQLAPALLRAVVVAGVRVQRDAPAMPTRTNTEPERGPLVYTTGAWGALGLPVAPRKGQMLRVRLPAGSDLHEVHRSERVYVVPRTQGPQAGTALIGATVEDTGFDTSITPAALSSLRQMGEELVAEIGGMARPRVEEAWAGLRPTTVDGLPILGCLDHLAGHESSPSFVATGHFRNGVLLAPATAVVMADLLEGRAPAVDLEPFSAMRFAQGVRPRPARSHTHDDIRPQPRDNRFDNLG